jgi:hypothetical protein
MRQDAIEAFGEMVNAIGRRAVSDGHVCGEIFRPRHHRFCGRVHGRQLGRIPSRGQHCAAQQVEPVASLGHHRDYRCAKPAGQRVGIDNHAPPLRQVTHVEGNDDAMLADEHLRHEPEVAREIARIDNDHDRVMRRAPGKCRPGNSAFRRIQVQVVGAGKIQNLDRPPRLGPLAPPRPNGGRGPGEIRRLRARAAQGVKERGLAGIRVADEHDPMHVGGGVMIWRGEDGCRRRHRTSRSVTAT